MERAVVGGFFFVDSACLRARLLACMDVGALWDRWSLWDVGEGEGEGERERKSAGGKGRWKDLDMLAGQYLVVELPTFCLARLPRNA